MRVLLSVLAVLFREPGVRHGFALRVLLVPGAVWQLLKLNEIRIGSTRLVVGGRIDATVVSGIAIPALSPIVCLIIFSSWSSLIPRHYSRFLAAVR